jgi:hypothetical protein
MEGKKTKDEIKLGVLDEIIDLTRNQMDMAEFGINVAGILKYNELIPEEIYDVLLGK